MEARAGQGIDRLSQLDLERLPDEALSELAELFNMFEECQTWPWQLMGVLGRLLPLKAEGQFRVIGLIRVLCRVWSLAREPVVQSWAQADQPGWDAAVRGNSSLKEAFMRALDDE
eukprot:1989012-Pyramimonas_sp.AAC.1